MLVGLTGGIACGKSAVSKRLQLHETFLVVDLDEIARRVVLPGQAAYEKIVRHFGDEVVLPDGMLDREAIGTRIFSDHTARRALNSATHMPILWELLRDVAAAQSSSRVIILDAPLLFESSLHLLCDTTVVVHVAAEAQLQRLQTRDSRSRDEAEQRVSAQMPLAAKVSRAQHLVDNNGLPEATNRLVDELATRFEASATAWSVRRCCRHALLFFVRTINGWGWSASR